MTTRAVTDPARVWAEMDRLTTLPTELISSIATYLDGHTLLNFRITCSRASKCVDSEFLERFFVDRHMVCTEYSLRVLWDISRNHRLRKRLRSLVFVFLDIPYFHVEGHLQRRHQFGTCCGWEPDVKSTAPECWMADCYENQFEILEWCSQILEAALSNLAEADVVTKIMAIDYRSWLAVPKESPSGVLGEVGPSFSALYGVKALKRSLLNVTTKPRRRAWAGASPEISTSFVLGAIAGAHYPVQTLSLGNGDDLNFAGPEAFHAMSGSLDFPWRNLRRVSLTVTSSCLDAAHAKFTPFQRWLFSLQALESLTLTVDIQISDMREPSTPTERCARLGQCLADIPLQDLTIDNGLFSGAGIFQILNPLRRTLRGLSLLNAYLANEDRWSSALVWMAQHLDLEYGRFTLCQDDGNLRSETGADHSGWTLIGSAHEVRQRLEKMAATAVFKYDSGGVSEESDEFGDDDIDDDDFPDIRTLAI